MATALLFPLFAPYMRIHGADFGNLQGCHYMAEQSECWNVVLNTCGAGAAALKIGVDTKLFAKWCQDGTNRKSVAQAAKLVNADVDLIERIFQHLTATGCLSHVSDGCYELTPFTQALADPNFSDCMPFLYVFALRTSDRSISPFSSVHRTLKIRLHRARVCELTQVPPRHALPNPAKLRSHKLEPHEPSSNSAGFFEYLATNPDKAAVFQNVMCARSPFEAKWFDIYPSDDVVGLHKPGTALVVDIGGGQGQDLVEFVSKYPRLLKESLVLQDLASVILNPSPHESIQVMAYDMFSPQAIMGARIYLLHFVLHQLPDAQAIIVLQNVANSMKKGYSTMLIHEKVIKEGEFNASKTSSDLTTMMVFSSSERTEKAWRRILSAAGMKLCKVWSLPHMLESVLEVEAQ